VEERYKHFLPPSVPLQLEPEAMIYDTKLNDITTKVRWSKSAGQIFQPIESVYGPCERRVLNVPPLSSAESNSRFHNKVTPSPVSLRLVISSAVGNNGEPP